MTRKKLIIVNLGLPPGKVDGFKFNDNPMARRNKLEVV